MSDLPLVWWPTVQKRTDTLEQLSHNRDIWNVFECDLWDHPQTSYGRGLSQGFAVTCDEASMPIKNEHL